MNDATYQSLMDSLRRLEGSLELAAREAATIKNDLRRALALRPGEDVAGE